MHQLTQMVTVAEAAERAGTNRSTITRWIKSGRLTAVNKLPGRTGAWLLDPAEIDSLLDGAA